MAQVWPWIAVALTLAVLSRAFGDNPLFRGSQYFFVGLSLGYTAMILINDVLIFRFGEAASNASKGNYVDPLLLLVPILLSVMLWTRLGGQQVSWLANIPLSLIFGVSAALALTGALLGTLLPQLKSFAQPGQSWLGGDPAAAIGRWVVLLGTILVLLSFAFTRSGPAEPETQAPAGRRRLLAAAGHWWLIVSLGIFFAGAMITYQTALIERIDFIARQLSLR
ncbi:MAG TPA: hypothetical protein VGE07_24280 [Herpetosiphonaceae bacterium]